MLDEYPDIPLDEARPGIQFAYALLTRVRKRELFITPDYRERYDEKLFAKHTVPVRTWGQIAHLDLATRRVTGVAYARSILFMSSKIGARPAQLTSLDRLGILQHRNGHRTFKHRVNAHAKVTVWDLRLEELAKAERVWRDNLDLLR